MAKMFGLMRIGNEPELRYLPDGTAVLNMSLAYPFGKKVDGKQPSQWVNASLWGKRAESLAQFLMKGSQHNFLLDDVHLEEYEGKNGKGVKLSARVNDVELGARSVGDFNSNAQRTEQNRANSANEHTQRSSQGAGPVNAFDDMTDDIPFTRISNKMAMAS